MIEIVGLGLVSLAVLALAVGIFDAVQSERLRSVARDRRTAGEQRRRAATAATRDRYPEN